MHSVTSGAVYEGLHLKVNKSTDFNFTTTKNGVTVKIKNKGDFTFVELSGTSTTDMYHQVNFDDTIPSAYRPSNIGIFPIVNRFIDAISGFLYILNNGTLFMYFPSQISTVNMFCSGVYLN
jgi:hypothetical protein